MEQNKLTLDYLKDTFSSVNEGIEYALTFILEYPKKPITPVLKKDHTAKELEKYTSEFKIYETKFKVYEQNKKEYQNSYSSVNDIIEDYIKDAANLESVPEKYREKLWDKAWEEGHSSGQFEVYGCLCNLVDIFND